jgi:hypothetical protein
MFIDEHKNFRTMRDRQAGESQILSLCAACESQGASPLARWHACISMKGAIQMSVQMILAHYWSVHACQRRIALRFTSAALSTISYMHTTRRILQCKYVRAFLRLHLLAFICDD